MPRLIWGFAGRTVILLVLSWGSSNLVCTGTLTASLVPQALLDGVMYVWLHEIVPLAGFIRWMPPPTFGHTAAQRPSPWCTFFQLGAHWARISWSNGLLLDVIYFSNHRIYNMLIGKFTIIQDLRQSMTKPTKWPVCPARIQRVPMKKPWVLCFPLSALRRLIRLFISLVLSCCGLFNFCWHS